MIHDIPWLLLEKYFAGETDSTENQKVKEWVEGTEENQMIFEQLHRYYQSAGALPIEFIPDTKTALKIVSEKSHLKPRKLQFSKIWWQVAAILMIGFFSWWVVNVQTQKQGQPITVELKTDTAITNITLSDGSRIWLNSHSTLKHPEKFADVREVYLEGEAYFEIAHDPKHPFIVRTATVRARVLGTKFDVCSYPSENQAIVNVTEGKVGFGDADNNQVVVTRNQKGTFDKLSRNITKSENNDYNFLAWKTHEFHFDKQPLETIFKTLAKVYHFNFRFDTPDLKARILTASFNHRPLAEIIQTISVSANVQVSLQNGIYIIK